MNPDYSCRVGQGRASYWWACESRTMRGLYSAHTGRPPGERRPTATSACWSHPTEHEKSRLARRGSEDEKKTVLPCQLARCANSNDDFPRSRVRLSRDG